MASNTLLEEALAGSALEGKRGGEALGAMFLGPVGENLELLEELIVQAIEDHAERRRTVYPDDPPWVASNQGPGRQEAIELLRREHGALLERLRKSSVPFFSYRYKGHMTWDTTLPATAGYLAGMLYNQNNVAAEGSPGTTALEIQVVRDLCQMIGFPDADERDGAWGHITCDGTVANIEALWAARNLKLYPFAVRQAVGATKKGEALRVTTARGERKRLIDLDGWELLNLPSGEITGLVDRLEKALSSGEKRAVREHSVQHRGLARLARDFDTHPQFGAYAGAISEMGYVATATAHYSWPKAASLLGTGLESLIYIPIDGDARMRIDDLQQKLEERARSNRPVAAVIVVIGSTQEGAVDPLSEVIELRDRLRVSLGMDFVIHADAAWGGYFASLLQAGDPSSQAATTLGAAEAAWRDHQAEEEAGPPETPALRAAFIASHQVTGGSTDEGMAAPFDTELFVFNSEMTMNEHTERQVAALAGADSVTLDPHKSGFVPYPAGGLLYRSKKVPQMIAYEAPIVFHEGVATSVGSYGIEGSKPGAAAAAVWLSHRVIRPDRSGYGRILGRCLFNAKRLFGAFAALESELFVLEMLQPLTAEERYALRAHVPLSNAELWSHLAGNESDALLFRDKGPDQLILTFAVNLKTGSKANKSQRRANDFTNLVFRRLSVEKVDEPAPPMIITASEYDPQVAGLEFVRAFRKRLGVTDSPDQPMKVLIATVMDPFLTDADGGTRNMVPELVREFQAAAEDEARKLGDE